MRSRLVAPVFLFAAALMTPGSWLPGPAVAQEVTAETVFIPGKTVGLTPPGGFELSDKFSGLVHTESGSSFLLVELQAGSYEDLKTGMTAERLAAQGITVASSDPITIAGSDGIIIRGTQKADEREIKKWILLLGTKDASVLLTAQDLSGDTLDDATVMAAFNSIKLRPPASIEEQVSKLPFTIGDLGEFRVVRTMAGSGALLTRGPKDVIDDQSQPVVVILRPLSQPFPTSVFPADLAEQLLRSVRSVEITGVNETVEATVAGADGYETTANALDSKLENQLVLAQWLRLDSGQQMRVLAILPEDGHEADLAALRAIASELRLK